MMPRSVAHHEIMLSALLAEDLSLPGEFDVPVAGLSCDSRTLRPGELFIAQRGQRFDAGQFAAQSAAAGAVAIIEQGHGRPWRDAQGFRHIPVVDVNRSLGRLADRFYAQPSRALKVIAITGTSGKTSVAHYIAQALEVLKHQPVGLMGTLGLGTQGKLSNPGLTTPDCLSVHRTLAEFRDQGARHVVMEASSHALIQGRLQGVRVDTAVFTNLSRDHLDYHRDMAAYAEAKSFLFHSPGLRCAVLNLADSTTARIRRALSEDVEVCGFQLGAEGQAQVWGELLQLGSTGMRLRVRADRQQAVIDSPLLGEANAWNLLTCLSVLLHHEVSFAEAVEVLPRVTAVAGRMQALGGGERPLVVVDYSHKPAALSAALKTLRPLCQGQLWCVFGCGGDRDSGKRAEMGEVAEQLADRIIVTDDNPRSEDGEAIAAQILAGMSAPGVALLERDRAVAIATAIRSAAAGDVVLIAGKGHETYQEIRGRRFAFSDVAAVRNVLEESRS